MKIISIGRSVASRYRSKVAVGSVDSQVDPIAVCVGYRGSRIKAVREELAGEHIDVVRYSEDPEVLIPNALQPATVEQVLLCDMIGRVVLVQRISRHWRLAVVGRMFDLPASSAVGISRS